MYSRNLCLINMICTEDKICRILAVNDQVIAEYLPGSPSSAEMAANISGCLVNSHSIYEVPMPRLPTWVNILGTTIDKEVRPLPKDISDFMEGAEHGVVLLTMGMTYVPSGKNHI